MWARAALFVSTLSSPLFAGIRCSINTQSSSNHIMLFFVLCFRSPMLTDSAIVTFFWRFKRKLTLQVRTFDQYTWSIHYLYLWSCLKKSSQTVWQKNFFYKHVTSAKWSTIKRCALVKKLQLMMGSPNQPPNHQSTHPPTNQAANRVFYCLV